ncbi:MAG TPA: heavy metal-binding domain-containing protein [Acidimicrobiales bacterium]|nr:heavy metal-binding domain-containing protein [Acidimicrobiales bacterium]
MLITTAFDFPGYETIAVQGEIFGLTVRARNIGSGCVAGLRSLFGPQRSDGADDRRGAATRLERDRRDAVRLRLARPVSEICAYGTGVWVRPVSDEAKQQYDALVALGQLPHQDTYELRVSELQPTETIPGARPR